MNALQYTSLKRKAAQDVRRLLNSGSVASCVAIVIVANKNIVKNKSNDAMRVIFCNASHA